MSCDDLECGYHGRPVLRSVSFELLSGGVTALLGPNGSGKSTLLKTISKSIPIIGGRVTLQTRDLAALSRQDVARMVSFVPQEEPSAFAFTVREVVTMGRLPYSEGLFDSEDDIRHTAEAMAQAECQDLADRPITELSGGERQRVLIARALAQDCPIMLLDEPTSQLDVGHQVSMTRLLRRLASAGRTVLVAIHNLNLATALADRALLIDDGRLVMDGATADVLASDTLDNVYGVKFDRAMGTDGRLRVHAVYE